MIGKANKPHAFGCFNLPVCYEGQKTAWVFILIISKKKLSFYWTMPQGIPQKKICKVKMILTWFVCSFFSFGNTLFILIFVVVILHWYTGIDNSRYFVLRGFRAFFNCFWNTKSSSLIFLWTRTSFDKTLKPSKHKGLNLQLSFDSPTLDNHIFFNCFRNTKSSGLICLCTCRSFDNMFKPSKHKRLTLQLSLDSPTLDSHIPVVQNCLVGT